MNIRHLNPPKRNRSTIDQSLAHRNQIINQKHDKLVSNDPLLKFIRNAIIIITALLTGLAVLGYLIS